jgi:competence protein ComFC
MFDTILSYLAPHYCCGCGQIGTPFCQGCIDEVAFEPFNSCFFCLKLTTKGLCDVCRANYGINEAWCAGWRQGPLKELINNYKFERNKAAANCLADILDRILPYLPEDMVIGYVETIPGHIRQRGYDHMKLIASRFAKIRNLSKPIEITRLKDISQRSAKNLDIRKKQMKNTLVAPDAIRDRQVLIIDDVITSGATLLEASRAVKQVGGCPMLAAIAHQPIDK